MMKDMPTFVASREGSFGFEETLVALLEKRGS
jgi:hypothetical protein